MVSIKALTLLTLSVSAVTAVPRYGHARFHYRALTGTGVDVPRPTGADSHHHQHHHDHNETETGSIADGSINHGSEIQHQNAVGANMDHSQATSCLSTHTAYVTSTDIATVTAPVRRWDHSHWGNRPNTPAPAPDTAAPAPSNPAIGVSVGISVGGGNGATATGSAGTTQPTGATGGASTGGKKGLSYNSASLLNLFSGASWAYNWAAAAGGSMPSGVEYVPMLWGSDGVGAWAGAVKTAISNGATHVLSFNEPDFPEQANLDPQTAAKLHIANVASLSGQVKVGSPAITNSNIAGQGLDWMKSFLSACGGSANNCKIDFLAFHWYNNPGTIDNFKSHVSTVIDLAQQNGISKVWLTEFAVNGGTDDQAAFLQEALPYLDSQAAVERYAYFMVGNGQLLTGSALNSAGKAYQA